MEGIEGLQGNDSLILGCAGLRVRGGQTQPHNFTDAEGIHNKLLYGVGL